MVNFLTTSPIVTTTKSSGYTSTRKVVPSMATDRQHPRPLDRRARWDRRARRGSQQVMDRRFGLERRRSSIDFSV
ncbi:MAG: hypothetical protein ACJAYG_001640 [Oceanicoccus sp.]|jgi:hypothetical protein